MTRHTKIKAPALTGKVSATDPPLDRSERLLEQMINAIETALATGQATPALVRETASLVRAIASASAERRAVAKQAEQAADRAKAHTIAELTTDIVIAWLRGMKDRVRREALLTIQEGAYSKPSSRGGVLG